MLYSKPANTPLATNINLSALEGKLLEDPYYYRQMVGALLYQPFTRPDLSSDVNRVSQFMHAPREPHLQYSFLIASIFSAAASLSFSLPRSTVEQDYYRS